jgi:hypothetical protein
VTSDALSEGAAPTTPKTKEVVALSTLKMNTVVAPVQTPDAKTRADALMQTTLNGGKREFSSAPSVPNSEIHQIASHTELGASNELKAKEPRKSQAKDKNANAHAFASTTPVENRNGSFSQTIESIKKSSTTKLETLFPHVFSPSPETNFFDDEPLVVERERSWGGVGGYLGDVLPSIRLRALP